MNPPLPPPRGPKTGTGPLWNLLAFTLLLGTQLSGLRADTGTLPPTITDPIEVQNIGYNLAHGRGYRFDWDDRGWRAPYEAANGGRAYSGVLARHGSYPTLYRPPLMPLMVAAVTWAVPGPLVFFAWRVVDAAGFAAAGCLLCDAAATLAGTGGAGVLLAIACLDPLRRRFIPDWWTEGPAFDLVSVVAWLMVTGGPAGRRGWSRVTAGAAVGLLCLDRAIFVLLQPALCLLLAAAERPPARPGRRWWVARGRAAAAILAVACLVQSPWWVRNVAVAGRLVPLGTQGGFNLPDEYGRWAVARRGEWCGRGIMDVWVPDSAGPIPLPPGYTEAEFDRLWGDRRWRAVTVAAVCTSTASELAVADAGRRAAVGWVRTHKAALPGLALAKARTLFRDHWTIPAATAALTVIALALGPVPRRPLVLLAGLLVTYVAGVAATHVVYERFLIPLLPPAYVLSAAGVATMFQLGRRGRRRGRPPAGGSGSPTVDPRPDGPAADPPDAPSPVPSDDAHARGWLRHLVRRGRPVRPGVTGRVAGPVGFAG